MGGAHTSVIRSWLLVLSLTDKQLLHGGAYSNPLCPPSKGEVVNWQCGKQFGKQLFDGGASGEHVGSPLRL